MTTVMLAATSEVVGAETKRDGHPPEVTHDQEGQAREASERPEDLMEDALQILTTTST